MHDDIQSSISRHRVLHQRVHLFRDADIDGEQARLTAGRGDVVYRLLPTARRTRSDDDAGTLAREYLGDGLADPLTRTRHDCHPIP